MLGAGLGALASFACLMAGLPVIASHAAITLGAGIALGLLAALTARRMVAMIVVAMVLFLAAVTLTPVLRAPVQRWIRRDSIPSMRIDAVVVLSSSVSADSVLDPIATERLVSGLEFMRHHAVGMLVTTRPAASRHDRRPVSDRDQRTLIAFAGDTTRWREVGPVRTTREEALRTAELLSPAAHRTIAVVTSPLHTRRACGAFERVGFRVVCVPSTERMYAIYSFSGVRGRLLAIADWVYERLGMIEYRARGWAN
jgi:uncharacterized SAM-binding protein YcdF (DUF218 family)